MPVCITGMHRSGTSLVAQLLSESGLYLGPNRELMPATAAASNPTGPWANVKLVALNDEILSRLGGGWDYPPPVPTDWSHPAIAAVRPEADGLVRELARHHPWGWQDPRTCFTLPFWQSLLDELMVVVVVRNPLEVAASMQERNGLSLALSLTLWHTSYQRVLEAVPAGDRLVTHFDAYFAQPDAEYHRIVTTAGLEPVPDVIDQLRLGDAKSRRHHRFSQRDLDDAGVGRSIRDLYAELCQQAGWADDTPATPAVAQPAEANGHDTGEDDPIAGSSDLATLRATVLDQAERLAVAESRLVEALAYEDELRDELVNAHQQVVYRDAEVMSTLGMALARYAPGAPAAIYYRQLLDRMRASVMANLPPAAPVAVASMGDALMLALDGRPAWHFPDTEGTAEATYTTADTEHLLSQLESLRQAGAQFLLLPAPAWSWSFRYPQLNRWIETKYHSLVRDDGICNIYDLRTPKPTAVGTV